jgi:hypothetical protein
MTLALLNQMFNLYTKGKLTEFRRLKEAFANDAYAAVVNAAWCYNNNEAAFANQLLALVG